MLKTEPTEAQSDRTPGKGKDFHAGYSPILLRTELKEELRRFRRTKGFGHDTHIERCLMSAAIELLLTDPGLHARWMALLADATRKDVILVSQGNTRGA